MKAVLKPILVALAFAAFGAILILLYWRHGGGDSFRGLP